MIQVLTETRTGKVHTLDSGFWLPDRWRVLPVGPDKRPRLRDWPNRAVPTSNTDTIDEWLTRWRDAALAIVCGPESGVLVIDVDSAEGHGVDGLAQLEKLKARLGALPETVEATTPSGGRHLFYEWPAGITRISSRPLGPGVDIKASRGYVVVPTPGRTPGRIWVQDPTSPMAALPVRWRAAMLPEPPPIPSPRPYWQTGGSDERYIEAALGSAHERIATAPEGTRHVTLFREAASLARLAERGLDLRDAEVLLVRAGLEAGLPREEVERTVRDALRRGSHG